MREERAKERGGRTLPCVRSKRLRVHRQNARILNTCGRFDSTHGGVLNLHGFSPRAKPRHHTHTRDKRTPHISTSTNTNTPRHFYSTRENSPSPDKVCDDRLKALSCAVLCCWLIPLTSETFACTTCILSSVAAFHFPSRLVWITSLSPTFSGVPTCCVICSACFSDRTQCASSCWHHVQHERSSGK